MPALPRTRLLRTPLLLLMLVVGWLCCAAAELQRPTPPPTLARPKAMPRIALANEEPSERHAAPDLKVPLAAQSVLPGIDVLEQQGFAVLKGKRVGLLTHPAGVNRQGESTISVLRRAPGIKLVALYAVEHGIYGDLPAEKPFPDRVDPRTGLMVYSLYNGKTRWASPAQLAPIDVLVIDLQDVGSRSYTFISAMRYALESCFKAGKEVIVLDRPNPLGGLKVDGPLLDQEWMSYVGAFRVPYVHGLTIGELARMSKDSPGVLDIPDKARLAGKLTVIPMRGWRRSMRWPETGLRWVPTSPRIPDYAAVMGYAMTGLGCYLGGFRHGVGDQHPFRGLSHKSIPADLLSRELEGCRIPGLRFQKVSVSVKGAKPATGIYVEITDWEDWRPTELSFYLMRLACKLEKANPFTTTPQGQVNGFLRHMGSNEYLEALKREGARVNVEAFLADWQAKCRVYQNSTRKFWLYQ